MIASIKSERRLELVNEPFFLEERPSSVHLPFKNRLVFFEIRYVSTSSRIRSNGENATLPLMAEEAFCENLKKHSIISSQHAQDSRECYDFDSNFYFRY